jgi:ATP-dependent Zn protease
VKVLVSAGLEKKAKEILTKHKAKLKKLTAVLLKKETLDREEIDKII